MRLDPLQAEEEALCMASIEQLLKAEVHIRELIESQGLPLPDEIEYGEACVRLIWRKQKAVVVIDVDDLA